RPWRLGLLARCEEEERTNAKTHGCDAPRDGVDREQDLAAFDGVLALFVDGAIGIPAHLVGALLFRRGVVADQHDPRDRRCHDASDADASENESERSATVGRLLRD